METALALLVGLMVALSVWLMLSANMLRFLFGIGLLSNAVNLAIFAVGRLRYGTPALIGADAVAPDGPVANALPQALILTAIVISFGLFAFTLVVVYRARAAFGTVEADDLNDAEPGGPTR